MAPYRPLDAAALDALRQALGPENVLDSASAPEKFLSDESGVERPLEAVAFARTTEQVSRVLRLANEHNFPVTPRGTGSGLAGGCVPLHGGLVLALETMDRILEVDPENMLLRTETGALTKAVKDAAQEHGLFYPPDPASLEISSIGGNAATDAGGPACVKYGTTREYILGLTAVLPTGEIIRTGAATRKNVVGYDLTRLLVGSEGTLAVITELILKLIPLPPATEATVAVFPDMVTAMACVSAVMAQGVTPSAIEFMDRSCCALVEDMLPFALPAGDAALLLLETDGHPEQARADMERVTSQCKAMGATNLLPASSEDERQQLWDIRRQISLRIHDAHDIYIPEDVAVPLGRIARLVRELPGVEQEFGVTVYAFGHSGDGNIHLNICADADADRDRVEAGVRALLHKTLDLDGTISGEHGIGSAKKRFVSMQLSPDSIRLQQSIHHLFDPNMILNPGKLFPE